MSTYDVSKPWGERCPATEYEIHSSRINSKAELLARKYTIDLTEAIARLIVGEETTEAGQLAVGREIFNRYLTYELSDEILALANVNSEARFGDQSSNYPNDVIADPYRRIIFEDGHYGGFGLTHALNPKVDSASFKAFKKAYDIAKALTEFIDFESGITGQVNHQGMPEVYKKRTSQYQNTPYNEYVPIYINERIQPSNGDKQWFNPVYVGESAFFNRPNHKNNRLGEIDISSRKNPFTLYDPDNHTSIPTFTDVEFVNFLLSRRGCGYAFGSYGQMCTPSLIAGLKTKNPQESSNLDISLSKWNGRYVCDCSGLIKWFLLKKGVTRCDTNANGMYRYWCSETSTQMPRAGYLPGPGYTVVFRISGGKAVHIGIYIGHNKIIEAKGCQYGVVVTEYNPNDWHAWGMLAWVDRTKNDFDFENVPAYSNASQYSNYNLGSDEGVSGIQSYSAPTSTIVFKEGDSNKSVEMIRRRLWADNKNFVVNDYFDATLTTAVKAFQTANNLTSDGKVGSATWRVLFPILTKQLGVKPGVAAAQTLLNYQNYPVGTPDGMYGSGMEAVVKRFQQDHQLDADAVIGDKSWEALTLSEPQETQVIVPGGDSSTIKCKLGDTGNVVKQVQYRLTMWQSIIGQIGTFDNETKQRVEYFQNVNGITVDGIVGNATWKKMFPVLKKGYGKKSTG